MSNSHVPAQPNAFVGRRNELADVSSRLMKTECRLLTVTGLGGSGKTRLAVEIAQTIASQFHHGVVFVALQQISRSDLLVHAIAQALHLTLQGEDEPENQLFNYLREKSVLLLLDNFEHLLSGASLVSSILANAPKVTILVTSREALNLQEEWLYPLKGLSIPPDAQTATLEDYEAVQLFLFHARRVQPSFNLGKEREAVIQLCEMTAGLPLAIELAASWLKGLTISQVVSEMPCNLDILATTTRNVEDRHRSMRAVFDQSWKLMSEDERRVFTAMSVFRGCFDSAAAEQVAGASLTILAGLVEKSLVQMENANRYSVHELLRQYGRERLEESGEQDATDERHAQYYAQLVFQREMMLRKPHQVEAMQAIDNDFENIRLAWEWSVKNQKLSYLEIMLHGLYLFGFLGSRYRETTALFQQALESPIAETSLLGCLLARRWGYLHWWYQADYREAMVGLEQALTLAAAQDDPFEIAFDNLMYAYAMILTQRYAEAIPYLETSKGLFESLDQTYYTCWVLHRLGYVYTNLNDKKRASDYTKLSLLLARASHNRLALVICLYNLGSDLILQGDYAEGKRYCTEALQAATDGQHQGAIAHSLSLLALCAFCEGDYITAQEYAQRSQTMIEDINLLIFQPYNLALLILLACMRDDYPEALCLKELASRHSTHVMGYQLLYWSLAVLSSGLGNWAEARTYIQRVLQLTDVSTGAGLITWLIPPAIETIAQTKREKAVELFSWIWASPDKALNWVCDWQRFNDLQTQLLEGMDTEDYQDHWDIGQTLDLDDISDTLHREFSTAPDPTAESAQKTVLTAREIDILLLIAAGLTNPQIAEELVIGSGTVKTHTLNIYRKLEVGNRTQAILRAQEMGLLPSNKEKSTAGSTIR